MPAELNWYEADAVTPLSSLNFQSVAPGQDYFTLVGSYMQAVLKNDGDAATNVTVAISAIGAHLADDYLRIAQGAGSPGAFTDSATPLNIGSLAAGANVMIWIDVIVPMAAPLASATSANLTATGT